jgi:hypothetical protein
MPIVVDLFLMSWSWQIKNDKKTYDNFMSYIVWLGNLVFPDERNIIFLRFIKKYDYLQFWYKSIHFLNSEKEAQLNFVQQANSEKSYTGGKDQIAWKTGLET